MFNKTKLWVILFSILFILGCASGVGKIAVIYKDGNVYDRIDLNSVVKPYDIRVEYGGGFNVIHVEHGSISVATADCPDLLCVKQRSIEGPGIPIVCLPHRLVIEIEG